MDISRLLTRVRGELRDLLELVLIPGLAAILPWSVCYQVFRLLSRWERLYYVDAVDNCAKAARHGFVTDEPACRRKWRLMAMVDQADFYLSLTRGDRWMRKNQDVAGDWPASAIPGMLFGFHWGVGMWTLRNLTASGLRAHALIGPQRPEMYPGRRLRYEYYRLRNIAVRRAMRTMPIDVTASLRGMLNAIRNREQVLAIVDVPSYLSNSCQDLDFLGKRIRVPKGVFRLAVDQQIPVTVFINGFDFTDGRHFIRIQQLGIATDVTDLMGTVFSYLEKLIEEEPAAWHFWRISEAFFAPDEPV
jgi:hypothetical protein